MNALVRACLAPLLLIGPIFGCKDNSSTTEAQSPTPPKITKQQFLEFPKTWLRDVDVSENIAFEVQQLTHKLLCKHLRAGQVEQLTNHLTKDFSLKAPASFRLAKKTSKSLPTVFNRAQLSENNQTIANVTKLQAWLQETLTDFTVLERCLFKPHQILVSESQDHVWGKFDLMLGGQRKDSRSSEFHAQARAKLRRESKGWVLAKLEITELKQVNYQGPVFADVSALAGVDFFRSADKQVTLTGALPSIRETVYFGGLTLLDWNEDGAPDFMAYELESLFSVFVNDGQGGFTRVKQDKLIPHGQASSFYLVVDIDNDGQAEIIGTRVEACDRTGVKLPIYQVRQGALHRMKKSIRFKADCDTRYVHLSATDVNVDGLPDLFLSGFDARQENSQAEKYGGVPHNFVDAHDGAKNRLLINLGKMRFEDRTETAGIDAKTRKTYLGHFFDYDQDGIVDLFVVNDFAANQMFKGKGDGQFKQVSYPPFTDNGFSMGVSVADYDADGDFDVYVSNMYSYAGNRVLAVTQDLDNEKRESLLAMARGNTLYERDGSSYQEKAVARGINNAQWAWGQQFFDYDNDGDLDLHVVNGLSSNPHEQSKKVPDF